MPLKVNATDLLQRLAPHRAIYSMHVIKTSSNVDLGEARGVMIYDFKDQCEGWFVDSKVYLRFKHGDQPKSESIRSMKTWESKNGLYFDFRFDEQNNGILIEEIKGIAILKGAGLGGFVKYTKPSPNQIELPKKTLFPTAYIQHLIKSAISEKKHMIKFVFDGATLDNPYEVSSFIGAKREADKVSSKLIKIIGNTVSWSIRIAYFSIKKRKQIPEFELGIELRADGIISRILQEFGDYSVEARLDQVELIKRSTC